MMALTASVSQNNKPFKILLVESRQLVRAGIERVLSDSGYLTVSDEAVNCDEAIRLTKREQPQIIMISLPGSGVYALDGARKLRRQFPAIGVLVLADESNLIILQRLLNSGVAACVSSRCSVDELLIAIETVLKGERYVSDSLARRLAERHLPGQESSPFGELTQRELQILLLVVDGKSTATIARELCLTQKTVNSYRNRLLAKFNVDTGVKLVHLAVAHGLITLPGTV